MERTWRLHVPAGAWGLPSKDPQGIYAACLLQVLHSEEWELIESLPNEDASQVLLTKADDRSTPSVATRLPLAALGSPDAHLSSSSRASIFAYTTLAHQDLGALVKYTMYSSERNWREVTKRRLVEAEGPGMGRLWRPDAVRKAVRKRLEGVRVMTEEGTVRLERMEEGREGKGNVRLWGLASRPVELDDAEVLRRMAEGPLANSEEEKKERKGGMKRAFELVKLNELITAILTPFDRLLSTTTTPFFFSSPSPTSLDLALFAHLSLLLFPPWPQAFAAEAVHERFSRLVVHTEFVRDLLWSTGPSPHSSGPSTSRGGKQSTVPLPPVIRQPSVNALSSILPTLSTLLPSWPSTLPWSDPTPREGEEPSPAQQRVFQRNRWIFAGILVGFVGVAGWNAGWVPTLSVRNSDDEAEEG